MCLQGLEMPAEYYSHESYDNVYHGGVSVDFQCLVAGKELL